MQRRAKFLALEECVAGIGRDANKTIRITANAVDEVSVVQLSVYLNQDRLLDIGGIHLDEQHLHRLEPVRLRMTVGSRRYEWVGTLCRRDSNSGNFDSPGRVALQDQAGINSGRRPRRARACASRPPTPWCRRRRRSPTRGTCGTSAHTPRG